ncbi:MULTISPECIES: class F sortase [Actinosynnema]|uniref:Peptidase C60 sortase A and B n=1 Tax=Actinosynnema pretiosum TaxID=42197 RepID=A0A290Z0D4_9PSEU|nr:class F sortase [Actinosynnema pretiosum]ATE52462.1 peptidase C60 sortase A and B [Actinosynnema pretiosum]
MVRALLAGAAVVGVLSTTAALAITAPDAVVTGLARPADPVVPHPLGDSLRSGRGVDLAGMRAGSNAPADLPVPEPPPPPAAQVRPGTVRLPLGNTAKLVRSEVTPDGVLPVPDGVGEATWWGVDLGAPEGATVLAGHVNWKGATGPFDELWRAEAGREVLVVDTSGAEYRFAVRDVLAVRKDELPRRAVELFGPSGEHRLVLVTCGGRWVGGQLGYEENRVVVATPVG